MKNYYVKGVRIRLILLFFLLLSLWGQSWSNPRISLYGPPTRIQGQQLVNGFITDANDIPLPGVPVVIKNSQRGTITNDAGLFEIQAEPSDTLVISYMGFQTVELPVGTETSFSIVLQEDLTSLGEVFLNAGYYTVSEKERTGNIARISAEEMKRQPVNNPLAAMQGHLSGVNIVQTTGVPGGGYDIEIRGQNFINGNTQPLFIIDGVPFDGGSLENSTIGVSINRGNVSPLNVLDPSIIESIEVLKDADATAIYGSRGANGVVLITTKTGRSGELRVTVNANHSLGKVTHFMKLMNTEQYLEVRKEALNNSGWDYANPPNKFIWPDVSEWDQTRYTDWQKKLIGGTAHRSNAKLTLSGGGEQTHFLVGGSMMTETTVFPGNSRYRKASLFNTFNHRSKDQRLKLNLAINYTHDNNNLPRWDLTQEAYILPPNAPELYDTDGNLNWEEGTWDNPLAYLEQKYQAKTSNLLLNSALSYEAFTDFLLKVNMGYSRYQLESNRILPSTARNPRLSFTPQNYSSIAQSVSHRESWIIEPQINWSHLFYHTKIDILFGTTFQSQTTDQLTVDGTGFPDNGLIYNLAAANVIKILSSANSQYNYQAFFGRINLNHHKKYILNLTGRRDGSSRFGPGKRFGNFGAIGGAWLFSEENIFRKLNFLNYGKLRGSYGITGSDNIGDYQYLSTYQITGKEYNGTTIIAPTGVFNPDFGWESNKKLELALELGIFKNHVQLNASWYRNRSSNQLVGIPLAATTGFSSLTANFAATVQNTGWELDFRTINIDKKVKWTTSLNLTIPKNKLVAFPGLESSTFANRYIIGKPLTIIKLYHSLGVNPETGIYEFEDYSGDGEIKSPDDKQWIEDFAPSYYGGVGNTFSYRNFSFNLFFQYKKQRAYNYKGTMANPGIMNNGPVDLLNRWQKYGDQADIMRGSFLEGTINQTLDNYMISSDAISNASFIRLRNIDISYHLPSKLIRDNLGVTIYIQGQNLWAFTKFKGPDPEQPSYLTLPPLRQLTLGIELIF